LTLILP